MRIPVFTSRAQRPSDAPGRPITARMRAEPFIQAELRKGEVVTEALGQVQSYALMRHKAAVEVQMSESLLAAEEEMMNLANRLKDSTDIYNVFKPDGSGSWSDNVNDMRERLADSIQSRSARDEFRARFNQSELSKRFQLKGAIDTRVRARAAAAEAARLRAIETELSDPFNATPEDYEMAIITVRTNEDAATRSGTSGSGTSQTNRQKLAVNIANNATQALVFDNPAIAVALAEALDLQDKVEKGTITAEEAYVRSGLENNAAYTLFTLQQVPREDALEIIYDTLGRSNRLYEAAERRREEQEQINNAALDRNFRGMFIFANGTEEFDFGDLMMTAPAVAATYSARLLEEKGVSITADTPITADDARNAFVDYFDARNYLTPEQRRTIDSAFDRPGTSSFATRNNEDVAADLALRAERGQLTVAGLTAARNSITFEYHNQMLNKISLEADEALNAAKRVARFQFSFEEGMATDTGGARASRSAYFSVAGQLETEAMRRRAEGNPMTSTEMESFLSGLMQAQKEIYVAGLISDRNVYLDGLPGVFRGISSENPLADLDALYFSLTPAEQSDFAARYRNIRLELLDYESRINR
jgi:hypothetical protein